MKSGHFTEICSCGMIIRTCRCPNKDKEIRVIPDGCAACQQFRMKIFPAEIEDGLADCITASTSLAYTTSLSFLDEQIQESHKAQSQMAAFAELYDSDLHFLKSVLVSTGWNLNDDVFDPIEVWVARHSPKHKPVNKDHDCAQIVGHMVSNWAIDDQGNLIDDSTQLDKLPQLFHLVNAAVIYKVWSKPELQEKIDNLLEEISQGKWFVSMECLFRGFDYALLSKDGQSRVVARNEQTAFLTKHLRAYGGTGVYQDYRVGRLLRNILFCGKGIVSNPANPNSVILADTQPFSVANSLLFSDFSQISEKQVYQSVNVNNEEQESIKTMASELETTLQAQLEAAKTEIENLKSAARENDVKELKARAEKAEQEKTKVEELLKEASATIDGLKAEKEQLSKDLEETKARKDELSAELSQVYAEQRKSKRIAVAIERLKMEPAAAEKFVDTTLAFDEQSFNAHIESLASLVPAAPKKESTESDKQGEQTVKNTNLENVQASTDPDLSTSSDGGVNEIQKAIAKYFGVNTEEK